MKKHKQDDIIANTKKSEIGILIMGGILGLFIGCFVIKYAIDDEYIQVISLILGIIFILFGSCCLILLLFLTKLSLSNDQLVIQSLLTGRITNRVELSEIVSYYAIEKEGKYNSWEDLMIFTKDARYLISSSSYTNYEDLKAVLIEGKERNLYEEHLWEYKNNKRYGIGFLILGMVFLLVWGNTFIYKDLKVLPSYLSQIEGTVLNKIELKKSGKNKDRFSIEIELQEYPKFIFLLAGNELKATDIMPLTSKVEIGERIEIDIFTVDLKKKLLEEIPMNFWDKYYNHRIISIYGLRDKTNSYFNLERFNEAKIEGDNSLDMYILLGLGLFIMSFGVYTLVTNKKPSERLE